jgi:predicted Holliday junction resolvase-like endonuclease
MGDSIIIVIIIIIIFINFVKYYNNKYIKTNKYENQHQKYLNFYKELNSDMDRYNIDQVDQNKIAEIVNEMVEKKNKKKQLDDYIKISESGLVKGCIFGYILGNYNIYNAFLLGATNAIVNPIILYMDL